MSDEAIPFGVVNFREKDHNLRLLRYIAAYKREFFNRDQCKLGMAESLCAAAKLNSIASDVFLDGPFSANCEIVRLQVDTEEANRDAFFWHYIIFSPSYRIIIVSQCGTV